MRGKTIKYVDSKVGGGFFTSLFYHHLHVLVRGASVGSTPMEQCLSLTLG